jgi:exopolysaccharide biosynthesis polyprenyl glycosylphosphotransferase
MAKCRVTPKPLYSRLYADQPDTVNIANSPAWVNLLLGDVCVLALFPLLSAASLRGDLILPKYLCFWAIVSIATLVLIWSHGGYRAPLPRRVNTTDHLASLCFLATTLAMLAIAALLGHLRFLTSGWTLATLICTPLLLSLVRSGIARQLIKARQENGGGALVVCYDQCPRDLHKAMRDQQISSTIAGILYLCPFHEAGLGPELRDLPALTDVLQTGHIQDVIFVYHPEFDSFTGDSHQELFAELLAYPAHIWMAFEVMPGVPAMFQRNASCCKLVPLVPENLVTSRNIAKRLVDVLAGCALLVLSFPLFLICALLVRLSGPGPVIFRQIRTGAQGRKFTVLKFRTMVHRPAPNFTQASRGDVRVTKIGYFLRRTSLDELLQLLNVIRGDMSLVGPRPHAPETRVEGIGFENALKLYRLRHRVKPGITGLAQVRGQRGETRTLSSLEQRLASDLEYIRSWSLWLDFLILLRTIPAVISQRNAW